MKRLWFLAPAALLLVGCAHPFHAGAAATVGSQRISTSTLRAMVDRGLAVVPADATQKPTATQLERSDLSQLIQLQVVEKLASDLHVPTLTGQQIDAEVTAQKSQLQQSLQQQAAQSGQAAGNTDPTHYLHTLGIDDQTLRSYVEVFAYRKAVLAALPTSQAQLEAAYQENLASYQQVHVAHILVKTKAAAQAVLAQVKAHPSRFAALAKKDSIDTASAAKGGDLGFAPRSAYVAPFATAAFAGKDGTIVGPVQTQFGFHIIKIIEHRTTTLEQATPALKQQLNGAEFVTRYLAAAKAASISVSPRFGAFQVTEKGIAQNGDFGSIVASTKGDLSTPVGGSPSPAASPPAGQR